ncbi:MAG: acyl-CoA thioesterase [Bernardetiaceae bacterium]
MARIKLTFPEENIRFETTLRVRVSDLNYGNHLSNDRFLVYAHEARLRYIQHLGYPSELEVAGIGLIIGDAAMVFLQQAFLGDQIRIELAVGEYSRVAFELYYRLTREADKAVIGIVKTNMVCFDYAQTQQVAALPSALRAQLDA